jgi:hypothetical protein
MRWIAEPSVARRTLQDNGAHIRIRETFDARVFFAKANTT